MTVFVAVRIIFWGIWAMSSPPKKFFGGSSPLSPMIYAPDHRGSVLGPLLFVLYSADVIQIAAGHGVSIHAYADDMQTYAAPDQQTVTDRILACVADIDSWMSSNRLKMNAEKTEFIWLGTRQQMAKVTVSPLQVKD